MLEVLPRDADADPTRQAADLLLSFALLADHLGQGLARRQVVVLDASVELQEHAQLGQCEVHARDDATPAVTDLVLRLEPGQSLRPQHVAGTRLTHALDAWVRE